jgi:urease accessory protein
MYAISALESRKAVSGVVSDDDLERSDGESRVTVEHRNGRTQLAELYQRAPCRALFPRIDGRECAEVVFVNSAGGVAGGDRLRHAVTVRPGASLAATTQAAEKIYGAIDRPARIETTLAVEGDGQLDWLPQETIVFDRARLRRTTEIRASGGARVLALEWLVLGRQARGERLTAGDIQDAWRIRRDGCLVWADAFRLEGEIGPVLGTPALLAGCRAVASTRSRNRPNAWGRIASRS